MWVAILFFAVALAVKMILDYSRVGHRDDPRGEFPPGPRGLPVIGNVLDMKRLVGRLKCYNRVWCALAEEYGPVVGLRLGMTNRLIIVSGREAVVEMLTRPEFDGRPDGFLYRYRSGGLRRGILFTDGKLWLDHRRFTLKTLGKLGFGKAGMKDLLARDAIELVRIVARQAGQGPITNLRRLTSVSVINSFWSIVTGTRFDVEAKNPKVDAILEVLNDIVRNANVAGGLVNDFPILRHLIPGYIGFTTFKERLARLIRYFSDMVSEHKRNSHRHTDEIQSLLDAYLLEIETQRSARAYSSFDEHQLIHLIKDLFAAGAETTNNAIGFAVTFLAVHQRVQEKAQHEIERMVEKGALPSLADQSRLPYLKAILAEVMRMANIGPTTIPHRALADTNLCGYEIKKNYTMLANLTSLHMDECHWKDPRVFRPERFLDERGQYVEDPWLLPFGLGRRRCLGESLARNSLFIFIAHLLQAFHFALPPDHQEISLDGIDGFSIAAPAVTLIATRRAIR